ncbi:SpaA isopeptide-forming pilin-related protein [Gracilibacillus sp. Marseille-QA3620]
MKTSRTKTYKKSWQKRAFSILTLVFLLVQTVLSPVAQYVSAENTNVALSFNQTEALEGDTLTATLSDIGEDSGKLTFTVDGGLSIKGIADGQGNIDIAAQQDKTLSFTWKEGSNKTIKVNVAANEKGSSTATLTSENGGTSSVAIQVTAQEEVVSEEATEPEEEVAAASEESTEKETEEQTTESEDQPDSEKAADETAASNEETVDESSSEAVAQSDDSSSERANASAKAGPGGMEPDEKYYDETQAFGYDSMTNGGTVTGATVSVNGTTLKEGVASSTTGAAVENGILITFTPGYYLDSYKVVCGDKYSCRTDASGNAISKAEVMEGATVASIMLDSDDGITKTAFGHSSKKEPYWLLLNVKQDNTKYKVTYNWGDLEGEINTDVPAEKSYLVSSVVTVEAAAEAALAEAEALGYTFAGWKYTYEGYDGVTTMQPNQTFSMPNKNVTMTAIWEKIPVGSVVVEKVDGQDSSIKLEGVKFTLTKKDDKDFEPVTKETNAEGTITFDGLEYGTYILTEVEAPAGYVKAAAREVVVDQNKEAISVQVKNTPVGSVVVEKVDGQDSSIKLEGVKFTLTKKDDKDFEPVTKETNAEGTITFDGLEYGTYILTEVEAPAGYVKAAAREVVVDQNKEAISVQVKNTPVGSVEVTKVDAVDGTTLAGVEFKLTKEGDKEFTQTQTTDEKGTATFKELEYGTYTLEEVKAPNGYVLTDGSKQTIKITKAGQVEKVEVTNTPVGSVEVTKVDAVDGTTLAGVEFKLTKEGDKEFTQTQTTDEKGTATFKELEYGTYTLEEVKAPNGYVLTDGSKQTIKITKAGQVEKVEVTNTPVGSVEVAKVDAVDGTTLAGVEFKLTKEGDKEFTQTQTTDEKGTATFKELEYGTYTLEEVKAPNGYVLTDGSKQTIKITKAGQVEKVEVTNTPVGSVEVTKVDAVDGTTLAGVEFKLTKEGDKEFTQTQTTDEKGTATFKELEYGTYTLEEVKAPNGYVLTDGSKQTIKITKAGQVEKVEVTNTPVGSVEVAKVDAVDGTTLAGVEFKLTKEGDKEFTQTQTTDEKGTATFKELEYGTYTLEEVKAPNGYVLTDGSKQTIKITKAGQVEKVEVTNTPVGSVEVAKVDAVDGTTLAGVEFKLTKEGDKEFNQTQTTDKNGTATFKELEYGTYTLEEVKAPNGYVLTDGSKQTVKITKAGQVEKVEVTNTPVGSVEVAKVDAVDGTTLAGVEFKLTKEGDKEFNQTQTTDKNGTATFKELEYGTYTLEEVKAPSGYVLTKDSKQTIEITKAGQVEKVEVTNTPVGSVEVAKVDAVDGTTLAGVEFKLTKEGDKEFNQTQTTDKNGTATFKELEYGTYTLEEVKAPNGYVLTKDSKQTIEITKAGQVEKVEVTNTPVGSVEVLKVDSEDHSTVLEGAEFTLTDKDGKVQTVKTDKNGLAKFDELQYGEYTLVESKAPTGYLLSEKNEWTIKIDSKEKPVEVTIENTKENPSLTVEKTTDKTNYEQGETVNYTIKVTNDGNIDLNGLTLEDVFSKDGDSTIDQLSVEGYEGAFDLAAGQTETFHASYVIPESDLADTVYTNAVTVKNDDVTEKDEVTIVVDPTYGFEINKTADKDEVKVGESITYTIDVTNTGNKALTDINVVDEMVGLDEVISKLEVGKTETFTVTHKATAEDIGELTNVAVAKVTMDGEEIVHEAKATVTVHEVKAAAVDKEEPTVAKKIVAAVTDFVNPKTGQDVVNIFLALAVFMLAGFGLYYTRKKHKHE